MSHCWIHNADEHVPRNTYRICYECGHVWTRWKLWRAYMQETRKLDGFWRRVLRRPLLTLPSRIYFCQVCCHDW